MYTRVCTHRHTHTHTHTHTYTYTHTHTNAMMIRSQFYIVICIPSCCNLCVAHDPLIIGFGINGNGIDKVTRSRYNYGIHVHCTVSKDPSIITTDWFFANGTKVGLVDVNFHEGHYINGTTVLHIGTGRRLTYCDGGNYTCVVNTTSGRMQKRSFYLFIGSKLFTIF